MNLNVACSRCGREGNILNPSEPRHLRLVPDGWEGSVGHAVCPDCQPQTWHPLCTSMVDIDGSRVDVEVIPREELPPERLRQCE